MMVLFGLAVAALALSLAGFRYRRMGYAGQALALVVILGLIVT